MFSLACVAIVAAMTLEIRPDQRVEFWFTPNKPLLELCMSRSVFEMECPGCGLTRSVVSLVHAEWERSFNYHRLGWLAAIAIVIQIPYRLAVLRWSQIRQQVAMWANPCGYALIAVFLCEWISR